MYQSFQRLLTWNTTTTTFHHIPNWPTKITHVFSIALPSFPQNHMVIFQGPGIIRYPNSAPTKRNETKPRFPEGHASYQAPPRQSLESLESLQRVLGEALTAFQTIRERLLQPFRDLGICSVNSDADGRTPSDPQKDVFRFSWWFDSWWFSSHERYFPKLVVFQCDLGTFRYNPTNHGISKLFGLEIQKNPAKNRVKPPL